MKVNFKQWNCIAVGTYYGNGGYAIILYQRDHFGLPIKSETIAVASVNLPDEILSQGEIFIKDYSENEGMAEALTEAGIILPDVLRTVRSGHVEISSYLLTDEAINKLW